MCTVHSGPSRLRRIVRALLASSIATALALIGAGAASANVTGLVTITSSPVTVQPGQQGAAAAWCPAGKVVLGGGGSSSRAEMLISSSYPLDPSGTYVGKEWLVTAFNHHPTYSATLTASAVCGDLASMPSYRIVDGPQRFLTGMGSGNLLGERSDASYVYCRAGEKALAGGIISHSPYGLVVGTRPDPLTGPYYGQGWYVRAAITNPPAGWNDWYKGRVVCVSDADLGGYVVQQGPTVGFTNPAINGYTSAYTAYGFKAVGGGGINSVGSNGFRQLKPTGDLLGFNAFGVNRAGNPWATVTSYAVTVPVS